MKQPLGRRLLNRTLFLILFLNVIAFANVKVSLSSPIVYEGDVVNFIITVEGENTKFPTIREIEGYPIIGTSSSQSIQMINTTITRIISKTYSFKPLKSLTIPSFTVSTNNQEFQTKALDLKVIKPTASKNGADFVLKLSLDQNESYVGEALVLTIAFKAKHNAHADQVQLDEPKLEDFWVKKIDKVEHSNEGNYVVQSIKYQLFPQKSGLYNIPSLEALVGKVEKRQQRNGFFNDPFFNSINQQLSWKKVYSNSLKLNVKPLPKGLELYGNYKIQATVDKTKVQSNKPVNLTISVKGEGNIDDVKKFNININNVIVYADEPKIDSALRHNIYQGTFHQKTALISDRNFTIPSLELNYFDKATKSIKKVKTEPIEIEVIGGNTTSINRASSIEVSPSQIIEAPKVESKVIIKTEDAYLKYLFLLIGFILGISFILIINYFKNREPKIESNIIKAIRKAKDNQSLFNILLPHAKEDRVITNILNQLEENIYRKGTHKIDKEDLLEVFDKL
jgi:hypothetical protein